MNTCARDRALLVLLVLLWTACSGPSPDAGVPAAPDVATPSSPDTFWNGATLYFLLTDRFRNGDPGNDLALGRLRDGAVLRGFQGGDLAGVLEELRGGYFDSLGVNALWMTPFVEQNRGPTDEGTGRTYGYHGYWTRDWTAVDPALGTEDDLRAVVRAAHARGIRVIMDAVLQHTGPVTEEDPEWPDTWVRTEPRCRFQSYATTVDCTLVANLPDIRTDSDEPVDLPDFLVEKWNEEGRLDQERSELDAFFGRTGHPRAPRFYVIKWLTDWVREMGFDGYRVDTAKHFEERVSLELRREAEVAFADWKAANPDQVLDDLPFYMLGEVYNYDIANGRGFDFGDRTVDFFSHGYDGLINFGFKRDAAGDLDPLFSRYAATLRDGALRGRSVVNYVSSHDDGAPYDPDREDPLGTGTRLLLAPGTAQIYYGDEVARPLRIPGAEGDANLRSVMDWGSLDEGATATRHVLEHWRKLGRFRSAHPAVGAGAHARLQADPYVFSRVLTGSEGSDRVVVALDVPTGVKTIPVGGVFADGTTLTDAYSGTSAVVTGGSLILDTPFVLVLLAEAG
ncbi:MAG: alpha-amylase family glycosyl hydrolase [Gemmatimonadota bacterium]